MEREASTPWLDAVQHLHSQQCPGLHVAVCFRQRPQTCRRVSAGDLSILTTLGIVHVLLPRRLLRRLKVSSEIGVLLGAGLRSDDCGGWDGRAPGWDGRILRHARETLGEVFHDKLLSQVLELDHLKVLLPRPLHEGDHRDDRRQEAHEGHGEAHHDKTYEAHQSHAQKIVPSVALAAIASVRGQTVAIARLGGALPASGAHIGTDAISTATVAAQIRAVGDRVAIPIAHPRVHFEGIRARPAVPPAARSATDVSATDTRHPHAEQHNTHDARRKVVGELAVLQGIQHAPCAYCRCIVILAEAQELHQALIGVGHADDHGECSQATLHSDGRQEKVPGDVTEDPAAPPLFGRELVRCVLHSQLYKAELEPALAAIGEVSLIFRVAAPPV
mmetsp:Transcript_71618/g.232867  ORF Transcript_71618/g.232867 Transcript_71618/m.232867 type:complete len:389 (-) Transcript_71618:198-1364(-)